MAADDIQRASALAREMVAVYGMSPGQGRVHLLTTARGFSTPASMEAV